MTMNPALSAFNHVVAFEVAKDSLVIHVLPADKQSVAANKPKAIRKALLAELRRNAKSGLGPLLAVCEATGGYQRHVLAICVELGIAVHKAHGARVRHFARYLGLLAKTDPIDARVLALYGLKTQDLRLYVPLTPEVLTLRDLKNRRDQLQQMVFAETNRLEHAHHASVRLSLKAHIASLRKALVALKAEIAAHLKACETLAHKGCSPGVLFARRSGVTFASRLTVWKAPRAVAVNTAAGHRDQRRGAVLTAASTEPAGPLMPRQPWRRRSWRHPPACGAGSPQAFWQAQLLPSASPHAWRASPPSSSRRRL